MIAQKKQRRTVGEAFEYMMNGATFIKYGKKGIPKPRHVFLFDKFIKSNWQKIAEEAYRMGEKGTMKRFANPDGSNRGNSPAAESVDKLQENQKSWGINVKQRVINID